MFEINKFLEGFPQKTNFGEITRVLFDWNWVLISREMFIKTLK
jgi:hypothetical protein